MRVDEMIQVLDALDQAGVRYWVAGGWGVAALAGRQTREHRDLDLAVDAEDLGRCLAVLTGLGYVAETDWLPVRIELGADGERWVDVHPVAFDEHGHGRQAGLDGAHFDYPPDAFGHGRLTGRLVPCLSVRQQRHFHTGYEPRSQDIHDLAELDGLPGEEPGGRSELVLRDICERLMVCVSPRTRPPPLLRLSPARPAPRLPGARAARTAG